MIYLKENKNIITANLFVHKDFESVTKETYYRSSLENKTGNELVKNIYTESEYKNLSEDIINRQFDSLNLKYHVEWSRKAICEEEIYNELDILLNSNLPVELKKKYLKTLNGYYKFENFVFDYLPELELRQCKSYNIDELKKIAELSEKASVYTEAVDIISKSNMEVAKENSKVLKLTRIMTEFGKATD